MPSTMGRTLLTSAGRLSTRMWLRAAHRDTAPLRRLSATAYDEHAAVLPWPANRVLRAHLVFSVLPGAAVFTALQRQGVARSEAAGIVGDALVAMARPRRRLLHRVFSSDAGRRLFLRAAASSDREFPAPGWQATWRERSPRRVAFDMTRCFDLDMLRRLDAAEIAPGYCVVDDVLYADQHPQFGWSRSGTLATGAPCCDFCFELHEAAPRVTLASGGRRPPATDTGNGPGEVRRGSRGLPWPSDERHPTAARAPSSPAGG